MPNPTQVIGIIEVETTAELSVVLFGSVTRESARRWRLPGASDIAEAVVGDLDSLEGDLNDEYDAFCERLAT
jgi:predicted nucleotidyltransferase